LMEGLSIRSFSMGDLLLLQQVAPGEFGST
jgi:hypothetical protein